MIAAIKVAGWNVIDIVKQELGQDWIRFVGDFLWLWLCCGCQALGLF